MAVGSRASGDSVRYGGNGLLGDKKNISESKGLRNGKERDIQRGLSCDNGANGGQ